MTPGKILFSCPSCGVRLTVSESMVGISGPCPRCSTTIQSPEATVVDRQSEAPTLAQAPDPAPESEAESTPKPIALAARQDDAVQTNIRPETRAKRDRETPKGIETRLSTDDASLRRRPTVAHAPERIQPSLGRTLLPLFFIIAGGALVYGLCSYYLPGGPGESYRSNIVSPPESAPKFQPSTSESSLIPPMPTKKLRETKTEESVKEPPPLSVDGSDAINAETLLNRFLATRNLEERLSMIDPPMTTDQLQGSILTEPFPELISITSDIPAFDPIGNITHFPFRVSFQGSEGSLSDYTLIVSKRSDLPPLVAVQPVLDLLGGRLAQFAAVPVEGARTFHAVIEAMPRCFEENVPEPTKKFTYKLSACDVGRSTARAYASLSSSLAEDLWAPNSLIRWGKRIRATVTLQWNTTEDPQQPYIELLEIKSLDWNS